MKRDFIVHTVAEEDVSVQVTGPKGQAMLAKVPGITAELVDMENGKAHTHTFFDDLDQVRALIVPGQELTLTFARKSGAPTLQADDADPARADEYRNEALTDQERKPMDEEHAARIKEGKIDPDVLKGMEAAKKAAAATTSK
jgi:hypothetical protein